MFIKACVFCFLSLQSTYLAETPNELIWLSSKSHMFPVFCTIKLNFCSLQDSWHSLTSESHKWVQDLWHCVIALWNGHFVMETSKTCYHIGDLHICSYFTRLCYGKSGRASQSIGGGRRNRKFYWCCSHFQGNHSGTIPSVRLKWKICFLFGKFVSLWRRSAILFSCDFEKNQTPDYWVRPSVWEMLEALSSIYLQTKIYL